MATKLKARAQLIIEEVCGHSLADAALPLQLTQPRAEGMTSASAAGLPHHSVLRHQRR